MVVPELRASCSGSRKKCFTLQPDVPYGLRKSPALIRNRRQLGQSHRTFGVATAPDAVPALDAYVR